MAKKTKKEVELKEVARIELGNGNILVKYEDGSYKIITEVTISAEKAEEIFGSAEDDDEDDDEEDDEDDDEEDDDEDDEDDEEEITPEALSGMDFEELEDVCDEKELDTDPDDFDEDDVEKLRSAIAKELGITLPKAKGKKKGKK